MATHCPTVPTQCPPAHAAPVTDKEEVIDKKGLAKRLGVTVRTIERWSAKGLIPKLKLGGVVRFEWKAVRLAMSQEGFADQAI